MLLWYIFCWRYNQDLTPDERCGEAGEEGSKVSISATPPPPQTHVPRYAS